MDVVGVREQKFTWICTEWLSSDARFVDIYPQHHSKEFPLQNGRELYGPSKIFSKSSYFPWISIFARFLFNLSNPLSLKLFGIFLFYILEVTWKSFNLKGLGLMKNPDQILDSLELEKRIASEVVSHHYELEMKNQVLRWQVRLALFLWKFKVLLVQNLSPIYFFNLPLCLILHCVISAKINTSAQATIRIKSATSISAARMSFIYWMKASFFPISLLPAVNL